MKRIFVNSSLHNDQEITLSQVESHYVKHVLRIKRGEKLVLFNGKENKEWVGVVAGLNKKVNVIIEGANVVKKCRLFFLTLGYSILKGSKNDFVIQKTTELGVDEIIPFFSERTVVTFKKGETEHKKLDRWKKISIAASKQSGRNITPQIQSPLKLSKLVKIFKKYELVLVASIGDKNPLLRDIIKNHLKTKSKNILILIGPEGGFSSAELKLFKDKANFFSLGETILRAETAAIVAAALVTYELNQN